MITNNTTYKYERPYKVPFVIKQCFTNITVYSQYFATQIKYNIRRIKPYKLDTKVEDYSYQSLYDNVNKWVTSHILMS